MKKWLGLAATFISRTKKTVGAIVAASTLATVSYAPYLQEDEPPIWEIVSRILKSLGQVISNWPEDTPVNWASLLIQAFKLANLVDIGEEIQTYMTGILTAPALTVKDVMFSEILIAAYAPMYALFIWRLMEYIHAYRVETESPEGEAKVKSGESKIMALGEYALKRFLPMLVLATTAHLLGPIMLAKLWNGVLGAIQLFYSSQTTNMADTYVALIANFIEGLNLYEFVIGTVVFIVCWTALSIAFVVYFVKWLWSQPKFLWEGTLSLKGLRKLSLAEPLKVYVKPFLRFALMAIIMGVGPLLIVKLLAPWMNGMALGAFIAAIMILAYAGPNELIQHGDEYYARLKTWAEHSRGGELLDEEPEPEPEAPRREGVAGWVQDRWDRMPPLAKLPYQAQIKVAEVIMMTDPKLAIAAKPIMSAIKGEGDPQAAIQTVIQALPKRPTGPWTKLPPSILAMRGTLSSDPTINAAMLAWLTDQYTSGPPIRTPEEMVAAAQAEVQKRMATAQQFVDVMAQRGKEYQDQINRAMGAGGGT